MSVDPYTPQSGDAAYSVREYRLKLRYRVATNRLDGEAQILAVAKEDLSSFHVDLVGLQATKVRLDDEKRTPFKQGSRRLTISPTQLLAAGQRFVLRVRYSGSPGPRNSPWGRIGWEELDDGMLVASQPTGAPTWFPCNDRPADKARYHIEVTAEEGYAVVATGDLTSRSTASGRTTWTYEEPIPTATYLAALHVGRYRTAPLGLPGVPGDVHYPSDAHDPVMTDLAPPPRMFSNGCQRGRPGRVRDRRRSPSRANGLSQQGRMTGRAPASRLKFRPSHLARGTFVVPLRGVKGWP